MEVDKAQNCGLEGGAEGTVSGEDFIASVGVDVYMCRLIFYHWCEE